MKVFRHYEELPADVQGSAVAIGNFDGVHKGHRAVIGEAGRIARADNRPWTVLTFEPHPRTVFRPDDPNFRITPFRTKTRLIEDLGVDALIVLHFDKDFSQRPAEDFVNHILKGGLNAHHVVAGYDFVFGRARGGDCDMLLHSGRELGFGFTAVSAVKDDAGLAYSSTRVRDYMMDADPKGAESVLGHPFEVDGRVEHGDARGRTIGFPTANVHLNEYLCPAKGVYAIRTGVDEGANTVWHDGVANLGSRPTFNGDGVVLEAHLFDYTGDLYGKHLRIQFVDYLRPEQKFDGLEALKAQIETDCDAARALLAQI